MRAQDLGSALSHLSWQAIRQPSQDVELATDRRGSARRLRMHPAFAVRIGRPWSGGEPPSSRRSPRDGSADWRSLTGRWCRN